MAVRLGALYPQTEIGTEDAGRFARGVEKLGLDHLLIYDHILGAVPEAHPEVKGPWSFTIDHALEEPFVLYGYLAAVAPSLELATGIVIAPQRQTALLAKQAAQVDLLTGGKFRLGVGQGWNPVEYEALGVPFKGRGRRLEEQIELMRLLWTQPVVNFAGEFHTMNAAGLNPLPAQRPIPVWLGGSSEIALHRAARIGDGFIPQHPLEDGWAPTLERMRRWRDEAGRDADDLGIEARINLAAGGPDDWASAADEWRELGATHFALSTFRGDLGSDPDAHLARLAHGVEIIRG